MNLLLAVPLTVFPAAAADTAFAPSLSVSEEYTDNIYEQSADKRAEYTTRVSPGATFRYTSPFWMWDLFYTFEYRTYARNSGDDEYNHTGAAKGTITLIDKFLFIDASDTYQRVTLDVSRNAATESSLFLNQTEQNIASVSPYLLWRLRGDSVLKTGYRFTDTRYSGTNGIDKQEQRGFSDLTHELTSRFSLSAGYSFTRLDSSPADTDQQLFAKYDKHDINGGFRYEYADKSFLSGQIGNSWQRFDNGTQTHYLFWNAGISHDFDGIVVVLETKVATTEDPLAVSTKETSYTGKIDKLLARGALGLSGGYSEYVNTETGSWDRRKSTVTAMCRYEILQNLTAALTATGEHFEWKVVSNSLIDRPYRLTGVAGFNYALKDGLTIGLTGTYTDNRLDLDRSNGSYQISKAVVEVKKVF
ncbi:MAG: TIGR03016 family PEP-CTERM system-associated outer membrane protein [Desulfuromonadaceae bacterium]|nr:TIGR03016 family PEP-CTERM system-associated outer membrane protein [Desulfuromonadaceae bacterium]